MIFLFNEICIGHFICRQLQSFDLNFCNWNNFLAKIQFFTMMRVLHITKGNNHMMWDPETGYMHQNSRIIEDVCSLALLYHFFVIELFLSFFIDCSAVTDELYTIKNTIGLLWSESPYGPFHLNYISPTHQHLTMIFYILDFNSSFHHPFRNHSKKFQ